MVCNSSARRSCGVASCLSCGRGLLLLVRASSGVSSSKSSSRSYVASKFAFSLGGMKIGGIAFRSSATKSMGRKKGWFWKFSKPFAPIRSWTFFSMRRPMALEQVVLTGGIVTGYFGFACLILLASSSVLLPPKGRYFHCFSATLHMRLSLPLYLVVDALVEQHTQRPPVHLAFIRLATIHFRGEVGVGARSARQ